MHRPARTPETALQQLRFGFNDDAVAAGTLTPEQDASLEADAGADVVRVVFNWMNAQPVPGHVDFALYDRIYQAMTARHVRVLWNLLFAPHWTWAPFSLCLQPQGQCPYPPTPAHDVDAGRIAAALAVRYPDSAGIEVWNEPNSSDFWATQADPAAYAGLLRAVYTAVKAAAPATPVVMGGLSSPSPAGPGTYSLPDYLSRLLKLGAGSYTDAISIHDYPNPADPPWFDRVIAQTRAVRKQYGLDDKPIWMTETGLSTTDSRDPLSDSEQAAGLVAVFTDVAAQSDIPVLIVHSLAPEGPTGTPEPGYGVLNLGLLPKPAYCALGRLRLAKAPC